MTQFLFSKARIQRNLCCVTNNPCLIYYLFLSKHRPHFLTNFITACATFNPRQPQHVAPHCSWWSVLSERCVWFLNAVKRKTKSRDLKTFIFHLQRAYRGHPLSKRLTNSSWKGLICDVNLISPQFKVMRMGKERILFAGK